MRHLKLTLTDEEYEAVKERAGFEPVASYGRRAVLAFLGLVKDVRGEMAKERAAEKAQKISKTTAKDGGVGGEATGQSAAPRPGFRVTHANEVYETETVDDLNKQIQRGLSQSVAMTMGEYVEGPEYVPPASTPAWMDSEPGPHSRSQERRLKTQKPRVKTGPAKVPGVKRGMEVREPLWKNKEKKTLL